MCVPTILIIKSSIDYYSKCDEVISIHNLIAENTYMYVCLETAQRRRRLLCCWWGWWSDRYHNRLIIIISADFKYIYSSFTIAFASQRDLKRLNKATNQFSKHSNISSSSSLGCECELSVSSGPNPDYAFLRFD